MAATRYPRKPAHVQDIKVQVDDDFPGSPESAIYLFASPTFLTVHEARELSKVIADAADEWVEAHGEP